MMATQTSDRSFFGHPRGLATLFFTEMWERFSYYGMRAILILFMVDKVEKGGLGWSDNKAGSVYVLERRASQHPDSRAGRARRGQYVSGTFFAGLGILPPPGA